MGAGKTTFTRYLLKTLGLDVNTPVTSPTFAYMNEYLIGKRLYAHLDLYRLTQDWDPEELGLNIEKGFAGVIIEWPRNGQNIDLLQATHRLEISSSTHENFRDYRLFSSAT
jgi:tRNA threonylcarbamoyladenosine biosynthesis protein TsaE